jgi:GDP-4-dehydro-6-deoxy-D-mannose reductase
VRFLITGATGFVGPHLAAELGGSRPDAEITGLTWGDDDPAPFKAAAPGSRLIAGNLADRAWLGPMLDETRPDAVFHLAAASSVASSWTAPARALETNAVGTANLLEAIAESGLDPVMVVSSTSELYGRVDPDNGPVLEDAPLAPVSPYGTSKLAQDFLTNQFHTGRGLATVRLRFFHLTGPGRPPQFVGSSFARQIARAELGIDEPVLRVGNLEAIRDFTDVRDAVRACRLAADRRHAGEVFNVCTGRSTSIQTIVDLLLGLARCRIDVEIDEGRLRRSDLPWLVGDPAKLETATGWRAEIPLERTLGDLLEWWRHTLTVDDHEVPARRNRTS